MYFLQVVDFVAVRVCEVDVLSRHKRRGVNALCCRVRSVVCVGFLFCLLDRLLNGLLRHGLSSLPVSTLKFHARCGMKVALLE